MLHKLIWRDDQSAWSDHEAEQMLRGVALFGKDSGSQQVQPTASSTSQSSLPAYVQPYFEGLLDRTDATSSDPYTTYGGQRIGNLSDQTQQGFGQLAGLANSGAPAEFGTATQALTGVANAPNLQQQGQYGGLGAFTDQGTAQSYTNPFTSGVPQAQAAQFGDLGSFADQGTAQRYMDPYMQNVLNTQQDRLTQRFGEDQLGRDAQAVGAGAFSNSRRGVMDGIAQRELSQQRNELDALGLSQAYQTGSNIFNQERNAELAERNRAGGLDMQAQGMNIGSQFQGQQMGLDAYGQDQSSRLSNRSLNQDVFSGNQSRMLEQQQARMNAAEQLRMQGGVGEDLYTQRAKNLAGVGGVYDEREQASMDTGYADFINQRDYERNQLNFYSGILRGVPVSPQQETLQYQAPPSTTSQLLGLGIGGLGLAKSLNG